MADIGKFVWHELTSTDTKASVAFYGALFGWSVTEVDMGPMGKYNLLKSGEQMVGGIMPAQGGAPSHWIPYASVESVDGAVEKAKSMGGSVLVPPTDIPNTGRFAIVRDPQGGVLAPFTAPPGMSAPPEPEKPAPGTFCWDDLATTDPAAASAFYGAIYGWNVIPPKAGDPHAYWHLKRGGEKDCGGIMKAEGPQPTAWTSYVAVVDVDAAVAKATGLGAKTIVPPMNIPGTGRFSLMIDPTGAAFAVYSATAR